MDRSLEQELSLLSTLDCAIRLIGCELERIINGKIVRGMIVETEAYDQSDKVSHSYRGVTPRKYVMFGPAGRAYVYFTYGMHYCLNVVVGKVDDGSAVLIRALEPLEGISLMENNRNTKDKFNLLSGPAKLCQALAKDKNMNGHNLTKPPLRLIIKKSIDKKLIGRSARIGVHEPKDNALLSRVFLKDSKYLSGKEN